MIKILEELASIRKELQNIRVILQSMFVQDYTVKRQKVDGKIVRTRRTLEDPLESLRKRYNIEREKSND